MSPSGGLVHSEKGFAGTHLPWYHTRIGQEYAISEAWTLTRHWVCWCLDLGLLDSRTGSSKSLLSMNNTVYGILF